MIPQYPAHFELCSQYSATVTDSATDGVLDRFYPTYDKSFILENEKEEFSGFVDCLNLNHGEQAAEVAEAYGTYKELVIILTKRGSEEVVGGANCFVAYGADTTNLAMEDTFTVNLNYIFVVPEMRGHNIAKIIIDFVASFSRLVANGGTNAPTAGQYNAPRIFLEINDPFRLTADQYAEDSAYAGIDQFARLNFWQRLNTKILDFPYVQPALGENQQADETLALGVLQCTCQLISRVQLRLHLQRFFGVSVLKGGALESSEIAMRQLDWLGDKMGNVRAQIEMLALPSPNYWKTFQQSAKARATFRSLPMALRAIR